MPISRQGSSLARHVLTASVGLLLVSCVADGVTPPIAPDGAPAFGRAATTTGPTVSSTLPKSGDKGQTLDVHVYGSGFAAGATATWALHGVADPSKVKTNSTTVVSSTELVANITIAPDATIDYWDVQVSAAFCCKTGVGTELFEVTSAMPVGAGGQALGVNDAGDIVGLNNGAYVVSGVDASYSNLGPRKAIAISQDGRTAVGGVEGASSGSPSAGVWTRAAGAPWPANGTRLPLLPGATNVSGQAYAITTIPAEGVTVIAGVQIYAVTWESTDGVTWTPRALPIPSGFTATVNSVMGISATGDIAGQLNDPSGNSVAVVWLRNAGTYTAVILPRASGYAVARLRCISPDGTILAGNVRVSSTGKDVLAPAYWTRNPDGTYTVRLLPTLYGATGGLGVAVYGVTVVGGQVRAVGASPGATTGTWQHAVMWTWAANGTGTVQLRDIGGVGTKTDVTPYAINPAGTIAVGQDGTGSIKWLLQP